MGPWPLEVEEAWPVKEGVLRWSVGLEQQDENVLPFSEEKDRELTRFPILGASLGLGKRVELGALYDYLHLKRPTGSDATGSGDLRLSTKIGITTEQRGWPATGLQITTKLPNADDKSGLGTDETDFYATLLMTKTYSTLTFHLNAGLGIISDPIDGIGQDDVLSYGSAVVFAKRKFGLIAGVFGDALSSANNDRSILKGSIRWHPRRDVTVELSAQTGLTEKSERLAVGCSITIESRVFGE